MGSPDFAVPTLEKLIASHHQVVATYCQPPRPAGRGQKLRNTPVHDVAAKNDIPVFIPTSLKSEEAQEEFRSLNADIAVVAAYGLLLPPPILEACPHGCINIHPSLLPRWRGAAPIQHTILAGDIETGICIMQMDKGLDTGDVITQTTMMLDKDITAGNLHDDLALKGAEQLLDTLSLIEKKLDSRTAQSNEGACYASKITKSTSRIDWNKTATEIDCQIRGLSPWPSATCLLPDHTQLKIISATFDSSISHDEMPGTILNDHLTIACGTGTLTPTKIQAQGKKAMDAPSYLRGNRLAKGMTLT